jgi:TonB-linked SusC/RagA family outer membrane protein
MKFSNKVNCWFPGQSYNKVLSLDPPSFQFSKAYKRKVTMRITLTFALLIIAFLQVSFAAGPVSGRVTDDKGSPLSGVNIQLKTGTGVTTNVEGRYAIDVPAGEDSLIFSYVGFITQRISIGGRTVIDITLIPDAGTLSDVVVIGYGKQRKVNLVGAVSQVTIDQKTTGRAISNISAGLEGLVPGLAVTQNSGMAGNNQMNLLIRGLGTVNNSSPLIVVDGMPDVDINRININDIETISVLKDATSSSVYGSRAANGVILITTKSGRGQKKAMVNFTNVAAVTKPTKAFDFMADYPRSLTLQQMRTAVNTLPANQLFKLGTVDQWMAMGMIDPLRFPNTNWWDIIMRDGRYQNYNLSASGGNEKSNFYISGGMKDEQGLQINNEFRQYNARFSFDYKIRDNMNAGAKFNGNWSKFVYALEEGFTDPAATNTAGFDMQYAIAGLTPYDPKTGYFGGVMAYGEDPQAYNPYTVYVNTLNRQTRQEANAQMYWDWTPIKGLTAGIDYSLNYYNQFGWNANMPNQAYNFQTGAFGSRVYVGPNAGVSNNTFTGYKTLMNARLTYHTVLAKNHDLTGLVVYAEEYWYDRYQGSSRNDRLYPILHEIDAALTDIQSTGGNSSAEGLRSYIGRVNYTAFNKYLLEANFRIDGSSKFLPGSQYGFFPSVAIGWRFTEEEFIKKFTGRIVTNGKLRASYGSLGNNSGVGRYEQQETLAANSYIISNSITRGFVNSKLINHFLTWEETKVLNIGLDLSFLNNRLSIAVDFYDRLTTGMNRPSDLSILLSGAYSPAPRTNIGNMRNRGIEGDFSWKDKIGKSVTYGVNLNASYNKTKLEKWNEFLPRGSQNSGNNVFVDMPYNFIYAYEAIGIAQTWEDVYKATPQGAQPGDILRKDLNGDGRIDANDMKAYPQFQRDRPTTYFALSGYVQWKGFDVAFLFQGSAGRKDFWLNAFNNVNFVASRYAATWDHWNNPWSWDNRGGAWPRLGGSGNNQATGATGAGMSTFWLDDMSYVRLKNIQLGYNIPKSLLKHVGFNNLRVSGSAENLATFFDSFRGLDPEKAGNNNNLYPLNKSYSISVNVGF